MSRSVDLPGELVPYMSVSLHAKVAGFVDRVFVDRGSVVKQGELLVELNAPELKAQIAEAESRVQVAEAERVQAEAQLSAATSTRDRLKKAAETPGAVAGNEVIQADKQVDAAQALVRARAEAGRAAQSAVQAHRDMEAYLKISAPFDGVVTERTVHPGALIGPGVDTVLLVLAQTSRLRLVVSVPEEAAGSVTNGTRVVFHVPAYPDRNYSGVVARSAHALDQKTRSLSVELDVANRDGALLPGMYPTVSWPIRSAHPALLVPRTSVVTTTERTFVIVDRDGRAAWVDVRTGATERDQVEVSGDLKPGDRVVRRATDELREGSRIGK